MLAWLVQEVSHFNGKNNIKNHSIHYLFRIILYFCRNNQTYSKLQYGTKDRETKEIVLFHKGGGRDVQRHRESAAILGNGVPADKAEDHWQPCASIYRERHRRDTQCV